MSKGPMRHRLSRQAASAGLDGEAVVLHLTDGRYYAVNASGVVLLRCIEREQGATLDELAQALAIAHGIDVERARKDVLAWLDVLRAKGLVEELEEIGEASPGGARP